MCEAETQRREVLRLILSLEQNCQGLSEESVRAHSPELIRKACESFGTWPVALEYAGVLTANAARGLVDHPEFIETDDPTEAVHIFLLVTNDDHTTPLYTHTKADADNGYSFVSLSDRIHEDN